MTPIDLNRLKEWGIIPSEDHTEPAEPETRRDEDASELSDIEYHGQHERFTQ